jgi:hypothetical protein
LLAAWWLERTRPRKYARMEKAELTGPDGTLLAEANGLMVQLLPGQP